MKFLSDYIQDAQTELFNKTGTFFAFSNKQFDEKRVEGVKYVNLGSGMVCPKENVKELMGSLDEIYKNGIAQDLKENGKTGVIERELYNHEAFYTWDWMPTFEALEGYGFTEDEVKAVFRDLAVKQED